MWNRGTVVSNRSRSATGAAVLLALSITGLSGCVDDVHGSHDAVPLGIEVSGDLVTVSFTNNGRTPVGEPYLVFECEYQIDGREADVLTVVATSCVGGCMEVGPGATVDFDFSLHQLAFADAPREPVPAGIHTVSITCPHSAPATVRVEYPPVAPDAAMLR